MNPLVPTSFVSVRKPPGPALAPPPPRRAANPPPALALAGYNVIYIYIYILYSAYDIYIYIYIYIYTVPALALALAGYYTIQVLCGPQYHCYLHRNAMVSKNNDLASRETEFFGASAVHS